MGLDFIRKAAKSFRKGLDRDRIKLGTPNLFTIPPDCAPRTYAMIIREDQRISRGEDLSVCSRDGRIVAQRGMDIVGTFQNPPEELQDALRQSYGEACGRVETIHEFAGVAEIAVC